MIETYKVLSAINDTAVSPEIPAISEYATRGNSLKIANIVDVTTTWGSIYLVWELQMYETSYLSLV